MNRSGANTVPWGVGESCLLQKFSDDTAIVGCTRNGQEEEYRKLVKDFVD